MSIWRTEPTRADKRAYHRLMTGITWHNRHKKKTFRFLTLTGIGKYRRNFDMLRRYIRKLYGTFEYFCIRTEEGQQGVIHLLFVGRFLGFEMLQEHWKKLSGSWNIHIQAVKDFTWQGFELTRQQLPAHYSHSKGWLPKGIIAAWKWFKSQKNPDNWNPDGGWVGCDLKGWNRFVTGYNPSWQIALNL